MTKNLRVLKKQLDTKQNPPKLVSYHKKKLNWSKMQQQLNIQNFSYGSQTTSLRIITSTKKKNNNNKQMKVTSSIQVG